MDTQVGVSKIGIAFQNGFQYLQAFFDIALAHL